MSGGEGDLPPQGMFCCLPSLPLKIASNKKTGWASLTDRDKWTDMHVQSVIFQLHSQDDLEYFSLRRHWGHTMKSASGWELKCSKCSKTSAYQMAEQIWKPPLPPNTLLTFHWRHCNWQFQQTFDNPTKATIPRSNPLHTAICQVWCEKKVRHVLLQAR